MKTILAIAAILMAAPVYAQDIQQRFDEETNPTVQAYLYAELLEELARQREEEGDLVGAYSYQYLYAQWAKADEKFHKEQGTRKGQEQAWDRVQVPFYAGIHKELARLGKGLTADERKAAIQQAEEFSVSNPIGM